MLSLPVQEVQFVKTFKKGIKVNIVLLEIKLWCSLCHC